MRENNIHNRIARIRFELGLNQKEFAEKIGITQASVSRYEKRKNSRLFFFRKSSKRV